MAVVRKSVLPLGTHISPDGQTVVTPARVRHFVDTFNAIKKDVGADQIGVPWSEAHSEIAEPSNVAFLASNLNAGFVKQLYVGADGGLDADIECPGLEEKDGALIGVAKLPSGQTVPTAIKHVSAGIWPSWTDGQGREYTDLIGHVALVTKPVVGNQRDFIALGTVKAGLKIMHLSTVTRLATDDDAPDKTEADKPADPADELDTMFEPGDGPKPNDDQARLARILDRMAAGGVTLPEGTTIENFMERLEVALEVLFGKAEKSAESELEAETADTPGQPPMTKETNPPASGMMLSTLKRVKSDPLYKSLLSRELNSRRDNRKARIAALATAGVRPSVIAKLESVPVMLSTVLTASGFQDDETDRQIAMLEELIGKDGKFAKTFLQAVTKPNRLATTTPIADEEKSEVIGNMKVTPKQKADFDRMQSMSSGKVRSQV